MSETPGSTKGYVILDNCIMECRGCGSWEKQHLTCRASSLICRCSSCGDMNQWKFVMWIEGRKDSRTVFPPSHERYEEVREKYA